MSETTRVYAARRHPRFLDPASLLLIAPLCVVGAIIGVQLIVTLGITANTSLIGALAAMALARVPLTAMARYRSIHVQNLAQSAISAATFAAGNSLLLPIGIPFVAAVRHGRGHGSLWRRRDCRGLAVRIFPFGLGRDAEIAARAITTASAGHGWV